MNIDPSKQINDDRKDAKARSWDSLLAAKEHRERKKDVCAGKGCSFAFSAFFCGFNLLQGSRFGTLCLSVFAVVLTLSGSVRAAKPLNVLFIVIDDLRPEIGCYGNDEVMTPNIDRLAAKGVLFNRAYCQYPMCNPSRASFLTGKRPDELNLVSNDIPLRKLWPDIVTLPQVFRQHGYYTAGIGKLLHKGLNEKGEMVFFRDDKSYDHFFRALDRNPEIGHHGEHRLLGDGSIPWAFWMAAKGGDAAQPDGMIADEAVRVLEANHDKPFFIGVGFHKPHDPFVAPKEYFELYPLDEVKLPQEPDDRSPIAEYALPIDWNFTSFKERDYREFKRAYHACTTFTDAQVGKLFAVMDRLKLWDTTIVVLLGDHGYHLGEHNWWNKITVYELGARAPFMMWVPEAAKNGHEVNEIVEFIDLYPTLIDYCGLKAPHELSGKSMRPVLEGQTDGWENVAFSQVTRQKTKGMMGYTVRTARWRYIQWGRNAEGGAELYDHSKDGGEYYNLAGNPEYAEVQKKLRERLKTGFPNLLD